MSTTATDVLIVGAGPTGLLLACELARRDIAVRIIDRAARPSHLSRALGIHSRNLEMLEDLGLLDQAMALGTQLSATNIYRDRRLVKRIPLDHSPITAEPYPSVLVLDQSETERLLREYLLERKIAVERKHDLQGFYQNADWVRARVSGPNGEEEIVCRYLVGCDGPRSQVREGLGVTFDGSTYAKAYTLVEAELDWDLAPELHRFMGDGDDLIAVPLGGKRFRLTAWEDLKTEAETETNKTLHSERTSPPTAAHLQQMLDRLAPDQATLSKPTSLLRYRVGARLASGYGHGRVFIAGDAAHVHPPTGGQGMNTGLQDAYNLGWKLALVLNGDCPVDLLESYEAERRPVGHWVLSNTDHATAHGHANRFELGGRRFHALGSRFLMARWNQLAVHYRNSPIVAHFHPPLHTRETRAGDRAPDGLVTDSSGRVRRLFELYQGTQHHLLLFTQDHNKGLIRLGIAVKEQFGRWVEVHVIGSQVGMEAGLLDPEGETARTYSVGEPTAILVRPDGYIGARADARQCHWLFGYLQNSFLAGTVPTV